MTTLYKPVLIESAEQAEALPVGTVALLPANGSHRQVLTKTTDRGPGPWGLDMHGYPNTAVVGFTALVPIEVEEETLTPLLADRGGYTEGGRSVAVPLRRLVTPWEDA